MISPGEWTRFATEAETIRFLQRHGILTAKASRMKDLCYSGIYTKGIEMCNVVGFASPYTLVIELCGELHCINAEHLKDMQDGMSKWIKELLSLRDMHEYVVLDFETTGFSAENDYIIEIGAIKYADGVEKGVFSSLVNPLKKLSSRIVNITGLTDSDLADAPTLTDIAPDFFDFVGSVPIVAHNAPFERQFLRKMCESCEYEFENEFVDLLKLARSKFPRSPNHKLQTLIDYCEISAEAAHRALSDARATAELFEICVWGAKITAQEDNVDTQVSMFDNLTERAITTADLISAIKNTGLNFGDGDKCLEVNPTLVGFSVFMFGRAAGIFKLGKKSSYYSLPGVLVEKLKIDDLPEHTIGTDQAETHRFPFVELADLRSLNKIFERLYYLALDNSVDNSLACCGRYMECSDAKICVHPDLDFAKGCYYFHNLRRGKIFYGKNRNID